MFARRSGISLFGGGPSTSYLSLNGINELTSSFQEYSPLTKEYLEIKEFININFMGPLMKKKMDLVKLNAFNFEYLIKKLSNFSLLYDDADIFLKSNFINLIKKLFELTEKLLDPLIFLMEADLIILMAFSFSNGFSQLSFFATP